jgi:hypothetical protein
MWWTSELGNPNPKAKSKFVVSFGTFFLPNIKSISKPTVEFSTKEYKLINHTFNYPGNAKWSPVELKFVCMNPRDIRDSKGQAVNSGLDTAGMLWQMINNTGYYYPDGSDHILGRLPKTPTSITTPEKASTIANSFGGGLTGFADYTPGGSPTNIQQRVVIQLLSSGTQKGVHDGNSFQAEKLGKGTVYVVEQWELVNPIIKNVNFGDLAYDDDNFVEYSMQLVYDYAIFSGHKDKSGNLIKPMLDSAWQKYSDNFKYFNNPNAKPETIQQAAEMGLSLDIQRQIAEYEQAYDPAVERKAGAQQQVTENINDLHEVLGTESAYEKTGVITFYE